MKKVLSNIKAISSTVFGMGIVGFAFYGLYHGQSWEYVYPPMAFGIGLIVGVGGTPKKKSSDEA